MEASGTVHNGAELSGKGWLFLLAPVVRSVCGGGDAEIDVIATIASRRSCVTFPLVESTSRGTAGPANRRVAEIVDERGVGPHQCLACPDVRAT